MASDLMWWTRAQTHERERRDTVHPPNKSVSAWHRLWNALVNSLAFSHADSHADILRGWPRGSACRTDCSFPWRSLHLKMRDQPTVPSHARDESIFRGGNCAQCVSFQEFEEEVEGTVHANMPLSLGTGWLDETAHIGPLSWNTARSPQKCCRAADHHLIVVAMRHRWSNKPPFQPVLDASQHGLQVPYFSRFRVSWHVARYMWRSRIYHCAGPSRRRHVRKRVAGPNLTSTHPRLAAAQSWVVNVDGLYPDVRMKCLEKDGAASKVVHWGLMLDVLDRFF